MSLNFFEVKVCSDCKRLETFDPQQASSGYTYASRIHTIIQPAAVLWLYFTAWLVNFQKTTEKKKLFITYFTAWYVLYEIRCATQSHTHQNTTKPYDMHEYVTEKKNFKLYTVSSWEKFKLPNQRQQPKSFPSWTKCNHATIWLNHNPNSFIHPKEDLNAIVGKVGFGWLTNGKHSWLVVIDWRRLKDEQSYKMSSYGSLTTWWWSVFFGELI